MAVNDPRIMIVGCGPGSPDYLTSAAAKAVARAEVILGSKRLLALFNEDESPRIELPARVEPALEMIAQHAAERRVAVLVSGSPGLFSLAKAVVGRFGREHCRIIPAVSSVQVAFARLGLDWADARILSAHGSLPEVTAEELADYPKIAVLAGTEQAVRWVCDVAGKLQESHELFVCENLTLDNEQVRSVDPAEFEGIQPGSLTIMVLVAQLNRRDTT